MGALTVIVTYNSGQSASGKKVSGSVSLGGMVSEQRTDSNGKAVLTWSSDRSLDKIFVDGKGYSGPFKSGSTEHFSC